MKNSNRVHRGISKKLVPRHKKAFTKNSAKRTEKAIETKNRQAAKKAIRERE